MMVVSEKFGNARKEALSRRLEQLESRAARRPVVGKQSGLDRDRVDALAVCDNVRIVRVTEGRGQVIALERLRIRNRQKVDALEPRVDAQQELDRLSRQEQHGRNLPPLHTVQRGV
jgi:hypothetical protein